MVRRIEKLSSSQRQRKRQQKQQQKQQRHLKNRDANEYDFDHEQDVALSEHDQQRGQQRDQQDDRMNDDNENPSGTGTRHIKSPQSTTKSLSSSSSSSSPSSSQQTCLLVLLILLSVQHIFLHLPFSLTSDSFFVMTYNNNTATKEYNNNNNNNNNEKPKGDNDDGNKNEKSTFLLQCLEHILKDGELPIGTGRPLNSRPDAIKPQNYNPTQLQAVFEHHWTAGNDKYNKWNADLRLNDPIPQLMVQSLSSSTSSSSSSAADTCSIWEVGAHARAEDCSHFKRKYPNCIFHAFEPVPSYFNSLQNHWKSDIETGKMTVHNYGLGGNNETVYISLTETTDVHSKATKSLLQGQGTYLGNAKPIQQSSSTSTNNDNNNNNVARIENLNKALDDAHGKLPTLLHINCEGCEWDFIPILIQQTSFVDKVQNIDTKNAHEKNHHHHQQQQQQKGRNAVKWMEYIPVIQISFHNYGTRETKTDIGHRLWEYCQIQYMLQQTHVRVWGVAFAWERWVLKETK